MERMLLLLLATGAGQGVSAPCADAGLKLPAGYCAELMGEHLGAVRQLAVSRGGVLYVAVQSGGGGHGVLAFADRKHDGHLEQVGVFGPSGVNDVALHNGALYAALPGRIIRWQVSNAAPVPATAPEDVITGLPATGDHVAKSIAFKGDSLFVNFGSHSNSCQRQDRTAGSPGNDPCTELNERAGIWVFLATRAGQTVADGIRYATGLRNAMALAVQPGIGALYAAVMGRDQLAANWGYSAEVSAEDPAEEFGLLTRGADYGWPYCYYSATRKAKILAPEYGGNGSRTDRCTERTMPLLVFPGHWAPLALAFNPGAGLGAHYAGGAFLAFHGSWNRAPLPQAGYRVVFIPFEKGQPTGAYETFATGSGGPTALRASGVAVAPDGALFISDDRAGRVWRVSRAP